ncbi:MAG: sulfotransferase family 2 domain-containing protein [Cryomorphaceae bacterium]
MIISHQKKLIFIHNYKVAGTSIRNSLRSYNCHSFRNSRYIDKFKFILGLYPRIYSSTFSGHVKAIELKKKLPKEIFESYFKFGFVRNPWDWQVSLYTYMLKLESHHQHDLIKSMKNFDEYIDWRVHKDLHLQKEFFYENDDCLVDFIGKMENLTKDFNTVCKKVNINTELPHLNSSRKDDLYLRYYSKESFLMVKNAFEEDIRLFEYKAPDF